MKPKTNGISRAQRSKVNHGEGLNWILIAGGTLLSTFSVFLGYKLKQVLNAKQQNTHGNALKGNESHEERKKSRNLDMQSSSYSSAKDDENCYTFPSGTGGVVEIKRKGSGQMLAEPEMRLPPMSVPGLEFSKENGSCSQYHLEPLQKPFHYSNSSESPRVSDSSSDIFSKREVIQKLRQQLKRRDDTILEMHEQIVEMKSSLNFQLSHSTHLQSLLDGANRDLLDSEREIQQLRKVITDCYIGELDSCENAPTAPSWAGYGNGDFEVESHPVSSEKGRGIEVLKREVDELKEIIEGKEYLLQSCKEQKVELSTKIKEMQHRLDSQLPYILQA
nr:Leucine-rich repeat-containing protein [Ipomoea batatas]GMD26071.1 Leucine-rich repeat-containing protein [Ipomoea batatas]GMD35270.1 Leucine-rich repeat-containing protein [Ipomoea batatas]GME04570.1 Leucine-rich repeat-containing protein [Ipomoea batatas]